MKEPNELPCPEELEEGEEAQVYPCVRVLEPDWYELEEMDL